MDEELARFDGLSAAPGRVPRRLRLVVYAVRAAARARLPLGDLGGRGGAPRRARAWRRRVARREHAVRARLHRRLRRARRRRGRDRQRCSTSGTQHEFAGFVLVVLGLAFIGLLPVAGAVVAPGLLGARGARLERAARRRVRGLRGARASAPCSARSSCSPATPARSSRGVVLLAAYSLGLGVAFVLAGVAFARAMTRLPLGARPLPRILQIVGGADPRRARPAALLRPRWWLNVAREPRCSRRSGSTRSSSGRASAGDARRSRAPPRPARARGDVDASVPARTRASRRAPSRAAARSRPVAAPGLVPGDGDVDETLEEVALLRRAARQATSSSSCASK